MAIILHLIALRSDCCRQLLVRSSAYGEIESPFEIIVLDSMKNAGKRNKLFICCQFQAFFLNLYLNYYSGIKKFKISRLHTGGILYFMLN